MIKKLVPEKVTLLFGNCYTKKSKLVAPMVRIFVIFQFHHQKCTSSTTDFDIASRRNLDHVNYH